jgi:pimeloyl-ACP methyl ester carboxylesterase
MAHVPGARLVTIGDAGHMLHHDQPQAVARALETFLA